MHVAANIRLHVQRVKGLPVRKKRPPFQIAHKDLLLRDQRLSVCGSKTKCFHKVKVKAIFRRGNEKAEAKAGLNINASSLIDIKQRNIGMSHHGKQVLPMPSSHFLSHRHTLSHPRLR